MLAAITVYRMPEIFTEVASIRMPDSMMAALVKMAESEKRPVGMMARILLEEALAVRAKKLAKR
ncbi:MAG: hypothetical protein ACRD20_02210 [Terriglobales bacterium]